MRHDVLKDSETTIESYPKTRAHEQYAHDQPDSAEVRVRTHAVNGDWGAATLDSLAVEVAEAASEGDTEIVCTMGDADSVVKGRRYVLALTTGERFWVRASLTVVGEDADPGPGGTDTTVRLMSPLPCAISAGSSLYGMRCSRALTEEETAIVGAAIADWRVTVGSAVVAQWSQPFAVVTRLPVWLLDEDELTRRMPEVLARRDSGDVTLQEAIDAALEEELLPRLRAKRDALGTPIREAGILSTHALTPAHVAAVRLFLARSSTQATIEQRQALEAELSTKLDLAIADADAWYVSSQTDDKPGPTPPASTLGALWYRR